MLDSKMAAGENGSKQRTIGTKWRQRYQAFPCVIVANLWTQGKSQRFSAKAV
jgi:hypothetical protein